ncbi:MAG: membrane protein insertase YidC [Candidatus Palauibacterales bacterium]|nr:membrane protein insertase YidC [Candidatus Palauibacterales bacterium]
MEKRVVLAVTLTIGVIFLSNLLFPTPKPPPGQVPADSAVVVADTSFAGSEGGLLAPDSADLTGRPVQEAGRGEADAAGEPAASEEAPADTITVTTDLLRLRFSTRGAALLAAEILGYESYTPNGAGEHPVQLVRDGDRLFGYRIAVSGDTVRLDGQPFSVSAAEITLTEEHPRDSLVFRYPFPSGAAEFVVTYAFQWNSYLIDVSGRMEGLGDRGYSIITSLGHGLRTNEKNPRDDYRQLDYVVRGQGGDIESVNLDKVEPGVVRAAEGGPFDWVAVKNTYFVVALVSREGGPQFGGLLLMGEPAEHTTRMVASLPAPAGSGFGFQSYIGPQDYGRLEAVGRSRDLEHVNPYGWRWMRPLIRPLVGIVIVILAWMHGFLGLEYGWVLIIFGVLMRVLLFPLYQKSMRAQMAQMQVQPLMKDLQARYKDEPQKLQSEMMKLYKEHNVNPVAGCLPMLLPMPILFALFFVFRSTIEFRGVPFLWLPDLSLKDPLYVIPLLMGVSMFLLSWIGQRGMEANSQTKMMTYMMPVVFTVMFANFPSGLNLYYATSNFASLPQQLYLSRERKAAKLKADQHRKKAQKDREGGG